MIRLTLWSLIRRKNGIYQTAIVITKIDRMIDFLQQFTPLLCCCQLNATEARLGHAGHDLLLPCENHHQVVITNNNTINGRIHHNLQPRSSRSWRQKKTPAEVSAHRGHHRNLFTWLASDGHRSPVQLPYLSGRLSAGGQPASQQLIPSQTDDATMKTINGVKHPRLLRRRIFAKNMNNRTKTTHRGILNSQAQLKRCQWFLQNFILAIWFTLRWISSHQQQLGATTASVISVISGDHGDCFMSLSIAILLIAEWRPKLSEMLAKELVPIGETGRRRRQLINYEEWRLIFNWSAISSIIYRSINNCILSDVSQAEGDGSSTIN